MEVKQTMASTENIWKDFNAQLFNFINKRVKNQAVSKDLLQDIFVKIHLNLKNLKSEEKLTSWVYQITRNSILDYFKKNKHETELTKDVADEIEPENFNAELTKCLIPFIEKLPQNYKEAILKTEIGNLSQKDYAEELGISYSGAKSRVQRAREELNSLFKDCCVINVDVYGNVIEHQVCKNNCGCYNSVN